MSQHAFVQHRHGVRPCARQCATSSVACCKLHCLALPQLLCVRVRDWSLATIDRCANVQGFIMLILHSIFSGEPVPIAEESEGFNWSQLDPMYVPA